MQFTKRDWRNRNKIKTHAGLHWLTIPVKVKGKYLQKIKDTIVCDSDWQKKHWASIRHHYTKSPFFLSYKDSIEDLYRSCEYRHLSEINHHFLTNLCELLDIRTKMTWSMDFDLAGDKTERLVNLCRQVGATTYISGPTAKQYINPDVFDKNGIKLEFIDYSRYPEYHQLYPPFEHQVSIIDLIFNKGPNAKQYMKSFIR
jgi:hypothetical protein